MPGRSSHENSLDIQTAVAFLTTHVTAPDEDDYKKLARVMRYLRGTKTMPLTLEADNLQLVKWWIDGAFANVPHWWHSQSWKGRDNRSVHATKVDNPKFYGS